MEMGVEAVVEEFKKLLRLVELEYENSEKKVILSRDIQRIFLPGQSFENLRKGTILSIVKWAASKLYEEGIVEFEEKIIDMKNLVQLEWKEKNNPRQLQEVPRFFYLSIREDPKLDHASRSVIMDIISLRVNKILVLAAKRVDPSLVENLSREEEILYKVLKNIIEEWIRYIVPSGGG
ncbi:MAG: hypothetical protein ABDH32_02445 [Candidatus Caldarchaeales archaeon]